MHFMGRGKKLYQRKEGFTCSREREGRGGWEAGCGKKDVNGSGKIWAIHLVAVPTTTVYSDLATKIARKMVYVHTFYSKCTAIRMHERFSLL